MTWPYYDIDPVENEMREARSWDERIQQEAREQQIKIFDTELSHFLNALSTISNAKQHYELFRLGFEIEDMLKNVVKYADLNSIKNCINFTKSTTDLINVFLSNESGEKFDLAQMKFIQHAGDFQKIISPTLCERFRGLVSMFLGSLITVCSLGSASSATAVRGYHLFFGQKQKVKTFKDSLLEDTQTPSFVPQ